MPSDAARSRLPIFLVFFLSGVSGLVYQVMWVRQLGNVFGHTVPSATLVTAVFMGGLGAGSSVMGRAADRRHAKDPRWALGAYGRAELGIAALGLLLALLLPHLSSFSSVFGGYATDARGWHSPSTLVYAAKLLLAVVAVLPPTFLMGGTLTLLIRYVVGSEVGSTTQRVGALYGANTAGAAVGALLSDVWLVPQLGVFGAQVLAVLLNAGAGVFALLLFRRLSAAKPERPTEQPVAESDANAEPPPRGLVPLTSLALLAFGFTAMGLEILWFRFISSILGELRFVFSILLFVMLVGLGLGTAAGTALHRRFGRPVLLLAASECLLVIVVLALLGAIDHAALARDHGHEVIASYATAGPSGKAWLEWWVNARPIVLLVGLPSVLMGMCFPLANAYVQRTEAAVGGHAGSLYLATTAGNVLGSLVVGFVIIPALGTQATAAAVCLVAALGVVPLYMSARVAPEKETEQTDQVPRLGITVAGFAAFLALGIFAVVPSDRMLAAALPPPRTEHGLMHVLRAREGMNETLSITEVPGFYRALYTNGHAMSTNHPAMQRYMRAFAHLPLLQLDHPERALVICFGVGTTLHATSLHPLTRIDVADLSPDVLEHGKDFAESNHDVLRDPRVQVFVNDGRDHLTTQPRESYDLVTLEPPPIGYAGVSSLYSREFYALARSRLKAGGYLTQWLPARQVGEQEVRALVRAFVDVFPESVLLSGDDNELVLMGTTGPSIRMDITAFARRVAERPNVEKDLRLSDLGTPLEIGGMFAASARTMKLASEHVAPVTDDRPSPEYSVRWVFAYRRTPRDLFDVSDVDAWCTDCSAKVPLLRDYLRIRGAIYASDAFLVSNGPLSPPAIPDDAGTQAALSASHYLSVLLGGPAARARAVAERHMAAQQWEAAAGALTYALASDPSDQASQALMGEVQRALSGRRPSGPGTVR